MRRLVLVFVLLAAVPRSASADVGLGLFIGDPSGIDLKLDLGRRSALDILLGWNTFREGRSGYGHVTYLYTLAAGRGRSVVVPLRLGIGGAVYGFRNDVDAGVRAPFQVGLRFRRTPIEIYGEVALFVTFLDDWWDVQGGLGLRFYF
ncbi:MAG: hypothetical protein AB7O24_08910 [Kofleriaceae bacterium]